MYSKWVGYLADEFQRVTQDQKSAEWIRRRLPNFRKALIQRAFADLKLAKPPNVDPKTGEVTYEEFLDEDVPNQAQWDGTDGTKLEKPKCTAGMYTTYATCAAGCAGGTCINGVSGGPNPTPYTYCRCPVSSRCPDIQGER